MIIPASGKGLRFGGPKVNALLETGETFLERILTVCREAGLQQLHPVLNQDTEDMLSSLCLGISEMPGFCHYLVFPVDFPHVQVSTIRALLEASRDNPQAVIRPTYHGRTGHPIIIPGALDFSRKPPQGGLRALIHHSGLDILNLELSDPAILRNINHPGD